MKHAAWVAPVLGVLLYVLIHLGQTAQSPAPFPPSPPSGSDTRQPNAPEPGRGTAGVGVSDVPPKAIEILQYLRSHHGEPPPGYVGGRTFEDREGRLKPLGDHYREYDVDPHNGQRNADRLVVDEDTGAAYFSTDHYRTFVRLPNR